MSSVLVILNYNDAATALKLVNQVKNYNCPDYIVVVDNMSKDDSFNVLAEALKDCPEKAALIQAPENGGYAKGNNYGIRYAIKEFDPDVIFVANPDVSVEEDTFVSLCENILGGIKNKENVDEIAGKAEAEITDQEKYGVLAPVVNQGANAWKLPGFIGMIESLFMVWFAIDKKNIKKKLTASQNEVETVGVVEGSFFCISREAYDAIDGLDENTFLYVEENILSKRLKNAGYSVGILTNKRYDHFHSVSIKKRYKSRKAKAFHNFYPSMTYYNKAYLKTGPVKNAVFDICYGLAYIERIVYDIVMSVKNRF